MAEDDLIIYYFDGTNGCDQCNLLTGYSFDEPTPPHPYCDCPVECIDMETEGSCHFELRDVEWDETYDEIVKESYSAEECSWSEQDISFSVDAREVNNLSSELEAAARDAGWSPPDAETITIAYTVPKRLQGYEYEYVMYDYYANVQAAWYLVCEIDGNVSAQQVDVEYGDYYSIFDGEITITYTWSCD